MFYPRTETESNIRNVVFKYKQDGVLDKNRTMDNVQKHNICINGRNDKFAKSSVPKTGGRGLLAECRQMLGDNIDGNRSSFRNGVFSSF
jgi:hypothetical protein